MNSSIREAHEHDASQVCEVLRLSITECCISDHQNDALILEKWLKNKTVPNLVAWINAEDSYSLVAESDASSGTQILGFSMMDNKGYISLCYVLKEALYSGIGKAMLATMEERAKNLHLEKLRLNSTKSGLAFYMRNGFKVLKKKKSIFNLDSHVMEKILINS